MMSKKGLGLVGIIIIIIVAFILIGFITTKVVPGIKAIPKTAEQQAIDIGLLPAPYYDVKLSDWQKGHLEFNVWDEKNKQFVTDFSTITGFKVSENRIPTVVEKVNLHPALYVAIIADKTAWCDSVLSAFSSLPFGNVYAGAFPNSAEEPYNYSTLVTCTETKGNYWTAIKDATYSMPSSTNYSAVIIISDGECTSDCTGTAENNDTIIAASQGLSRNDFDAVYILTSDVAKCKDKNNVLNATYGIITAQMESGIFMTGGCSSTSSLSDITNIIMNDLKTITLNYKTIEKTGAKDVNVAVSATKGSLTGRTNVTFDYTA